MNKRRAKQIYLLLVAIFGIVAISVYSTYAIFTLERSSDDIVSIRTPSNLHISASTYEYKQVTVPKNAYITTNLDIYNNLEDELCYSIWYKVVGNDSNKINIYENTSESLTTSSLIPAITSRRINLLITNDSTDDIKVNIGLAYEKNEGTCALNLDSDKSLVTTTISAKSLAKTLTNDLTSSSSEAGYLTYKELTDNISLDRTKTYYVANEFNYQDELFTLKEPQVLSFEEISNYQNYYICLDGNECESLYHISEINNEAVITKYDLSIGYLSGNNGLRKVDNNYHYFGDNPHNFIYYNCTNELDSKTCELWRIIGFYYDNESGEYLTKIIRNDYLDSHIFDENSNLWNNASVNNYLKEYKLKNDNLVIDYTFKEENVLTLDTDINQIGLLNQNNENKIMLINLSDYLHASSCQKNKINEYDASCLKNNWLNKHVNELTMTTKYEEKYLDEETNEEIIPANNTVYMVGNDITETNIANKQNIRPVIYLKSRTLLTSGDGTLDNPYVIR